jgi:hypothetical protein
MKPNLSCSLVPLALIEFTTNKLSVGDVYNKKAPSLQRINFTSKVVWKNFSLTHYVMI